MSNVNLLPSQRVAVVDVIDPDAYAASTVTTAWIPMKDFEYIQAIVMAGDLGASATIDAKIQQATDVSGTGAKDITGKSITQLTQAGSDSNKQAIINLHADELDVDNDFTHVQLQMTVAVATSDAGAIVMGHNAHYSPASNYDAASVDEIVA